MKPSMYSIPVSIGGKTLFLPCDGSALLTLSIARLQDDSSWDKATVAALLVANPALLLAFLGAQKPADRIKTSSLLAWIRSCGDELTTSPMKLSATTSNPKFSTRLAKSKSNQDFRSSLVGYLKAASVKGAKRKVKKLGRLSNGLIKLLAKSAREQLKAGATASFSIDLPNLLLELESLRKLKDNFAAELLRQKLDSMRLLAYGASHEINNPLANVATRAQSLLQDEPDLKRRHRLAVIYEQAMRAHEMISDMMLFSHPPSLELKPLDLSECVQRIVGEQSSQLERNNIVCEVPVSSLQIVGDSTQLGSAIKSLLVNAAEAIGADGKIIIEVGSEKDGSSWLSISDNGPGVDPAISDNIFDPFFSGREAGRGLGFGLSKAWRIFQLHNAEIARFKSELGGAKFLVRFLPRQESKGLSISDKSLAA